MDLQDVCIGELEFTHFPMLSCSQKLRPKNSCVFSKASI